MVGRSVDETNNNNVEVTEEVAEETKTERRFEVVRSGWPKLLFHATSALA
jgi:hypothetical protein